MAAPARRSGVAPRRADLPGRPPLRASRPPHRPRPGVDPHGQRRRAARSGTDRIPDQIATAAVWGIGVSWCSCGARPAGLALARSGAGRRPRSHRVPVGDRHHRPAQREVSTRSGDATLAASVNATDAVGTGSSTSCGRLDPAGHRVARARLLVDLVDLRRDAGGVLRLRRGARVPAAAARRLAGRRKATAALLPPYFAFVAVGLAMVTLALPRSGGTTGRDRVVGAAVPPSRRAAVGGGLAVLAAVVLPGVVLVVMVTPLVRPVLRRIPWPVSVSGLGRVDGGLRRVGRSPADRPPSASVVRGIGDVVCFGGFFALGAVGPDRRGRLSVRSPLAGRGWRRRPPCVGAVAAADSISWSTTPSRCSRWSASPGSRQPGHGASAPAPGYGRADRGQLSGG